MVLEFIENSSSITFIYCTKIIDLIYHTFQMSDYNSIKLTGIPELTIPFSQEQQLFPRLHCAAGNSGPVESFIFKISPFHGY